MGADNRLGRYERVQGDPEAAEAILREDEALLAAFGLRLLNVAHGVTTAPESEIGKDGRVYPWMMLEFSSRTWTWLQPLLVRLRDFQEGGEGATELLARVARLEDELRAARAESDAEADRSMSLGSKLRATKSDLARAKRERDQALCDLADARTLSASAPPQDERVADLEAQLEAAHVRNRHLTARLCGLLAYEVDVEVHAAK